MALSKGLNWRDNADWTVGLGAVAGAEFMLSLYGVTPRATGRRLYLRYVHCKEWGRPLNSPPFRACPAAELRKAK